MKTLWKNKETKRLFFNKYIYKLTLELRGICQIKRISLEDIAALPKPESIDFGRNFYRHRADAYQNKGEIIKIGMFLESKSQLGCDFKTRAEGSSLNIYTNERALIDEIVNNFGNYVTEMQEPISKEAGEFLKGNIRKILCNELPNGIFRYKVHIGYKSIPEQNRVGFLNWSEKYGDDRIFMPKGTKHLLGPSGHGYAYGQYFYVSDEKMLNMALMFFSDYIQKTENYILKSELV